LKVSVIIPIFNAESTIERAIHSVLIQGVELLELIIVDNASSDRSIAVARECLAKDSIHVQFLREDKAGATNARNLGLKHARGEWVQFGACIRKGGRFSSF
jgi:glycosyltransferase involved in cell wall biosynthesis